MSHIHIEVKDLTFAYEKDRRILDGLTFTAREKDAIGIIGANGAGKSTLLRILVGLILSFLLVPYHLQGYHRYTTHRKLSFQVLQSF